LACVRSSSLDWADLAVVPLIAVLSVPPLLWFGHHWTVIHNDAARYLLAGSKLVSDPGLETRNGISHTNHGPGLPALLDALILVFGRDTETLVWTVRLIALVNPLLAYFLGKRISGSVAGLISAALVTPFGYNPTLSLDPLLLTFYLLALLAHGNGEGSRPRKRSDGRWEARYTIHTSKGSKRKSVYGRIRQRGSGETGACP
jgi:hypothetical protein